MVTIKFHNTLNNYGEVSITPQVRGFSSGGTLIGSVTSTAIMFEDDDEGHVWRRIRVSGNHLRKIATGTGYLTKSGSFQSSARYTINHAYYDAGSDWTEFQIRDDSGAFSNYTGNVYYQLLSSTSTSTYNTAGAVGYATGTANNQSSKDVRISVPFYCVLPETTDTRGMRVLVTATGDFGTNTGHYAQILSITGSAGVLK